MFRRDRSFDLDDNVQRVDPNPKRTDRKDIARIGDRTERKRLGLVGRNVPRLIAVVLRMRFPGNDQAIAMLIQFGPKAKPFPYIRLISSNGEAVKNVQEFPPAVRAIHRGIGHPMSHMVDVRRNIQRAGQEMLDWLMNTAEKRFPAVRPIAFLADRHVRFLLSNVRIRLYRIHRGQSSEAEASEAVMTQ